MPDIKKAPAAPAHCFSANCSGHNTAPEMSLEHKNSGDVLWSTTNLWRCSLGRNIAMEMFSLDKPTAEEFYEIYKGVLPEFVAMIE